MSRELLIDDTMSNALIGQIPWVSISFSDLTANRIIQILQNAASSKVISYDDVYELLSLSGYKVHHEDVLAEWGEEDFPDSQTSEEQKMRMRGASTHQRICNELSKQLFLQGAVYNKQLVKHRKEKELSLIR